MCKFHYQRHPLDLFLPEYLESLLLIETNKYKKREINTALSRKNAYLGNILPFPHLKITSIPRLELAINYNSDKIDQYGPMFSIYQENFKIYDEYKEEVTDKFLGLNIIFIEKEYQNTAIEHFKTFTNIPNVIYNSGKFFSTEESIYNLKYGISNDTSLGQILPYYAIQNYTAEI